ncbi:hypothetical protein OHA21_40995 [Actinoplanes sp. NBC_00393]|uniref:hypothetical protein n=1 Tax=Actinoplanes sp. NBC_00393 TaxID=2975953 RepID=UPI002E1EF888
MSTLTAPMPAFAAPAPSSCERFEHFAAQAGAEVLRINRLDLGPLAGAAHRDDESQNREDAGSPANRRGTDAAPSTGDTAPSGRAAIPSDSVPSDSGSQGSGRSGSGRSGADPSGSGSSGSGSSGSGSSSGSSGSGSGSGPTGSSSSRSGSGSGSPGSDSPGAVPSGSDEDADAARSGRAAGASAPKDSALLSGAKQAVTSLNPDGDDAAASVLAITDTVATSPARSKTVTPAPADGAATPPRTRQRTAVAANTERSQESKISRVREDKRAPQSIGGVGLGDARSVLIADGPVNSAAAARILDGRVAGSSTRNDLVVQQAPPSSKHPTVRRTGEKRFGPLRAGDGKLTAHARWNADMTCGSTDAEAARSTAELNRITVIGAGSDSLLGVPEKIMGRSDTAVRQRDGRPESVASATITAGRISLADGAVRIEVLRAPELRVSMSPTGKSEVNYRPAVVQVSDRNGQSKRLVTAGDSMEITVRDKARELESLPALIEPIAPLPLPSVGGLPAAGEPESAPAPGKSEGTRLRIALGDVRQATKGNAVAARATAIKVSLVRDQGLGRTKRGYGPSPAVADLGIGLLEGAAVAPSPAGYGQGVSSAGAGAGAGLPITGPRAFSLLLAGAALLIGGAAALIITSRKRRFSS